MNDSPDNTGSLSPRKELDTIVNLHGRQLIDFLQDTDMITLYGTFAQDKENNIVLSTSGRSVVDYAIVQSACFDRFDGFEVATVLNLTEDLPVDIASTTPDHSLLFWNYNLQDTLDAYSQQGGTDSRKMGDRKTQLKSFQCQPGKMLFKPDSNKDRALGALIQDLDNLLAHDISQNTPYT